jgi:hypothetical protein
MRAVVKLMGLLLAACVVGCAGAGPSGPATAAAPSSSAARQLPAATTLAIEPSAHVRPVQEPADEPFVASDARTFTLPMVQGMPPQVQAPVKSWIELAAAGRVAAEQARQSARAVRECEVAKCPDGRKLEAEAAKADKGARDALAKADAARTAALHVLEAEEKRDGDKTGASVLLALAAFATDVERTREFLTRAKVATQGDDALGGEARFRFGMELLRRLKAGPAIPGLDRAATHAKAQEQLEAVAASKSGLHRDQALFHMAMVHLEHGDVARAEGPLMTLSKGGSGWRALAQYTLGRTRHAQGKWSEALGWFVRSLDSGFVPMDSPMRLVAADAAAETALRQSGWMHKQPGHPASDRDAIAALTTPEMASMRADVLCIVSLHVMRQALERSDSITAAAAAQVILDRAPHSVEAPYALAMLAAHAERRGDSSKAASFRDKLATEYGASSEWASALRKSERHHGESDLRFAHALAGASSSGAQQPANLTLLKGTMPALRVADPSLEGQVKRLIDHCLSPFEDKPVAVGLSIVGAASEEPTVSEVSAPGLPQGAIECLRDDAFAFLRQVPPAARNVQVK